MVLVLNHNSDLCYWFKLVGQKLRLQQNWFFSFCFFVVHIWKIDAVALNNRFGLILVVSAEICLYINVCLVSLSKLILPTVKHNFSANIDV